MQNRNRNHPVAAILLLVALVILASSASFAAPVMLAPGFPMRAGNVIMIMFIPVPGASEYKILRKVGEEATFTEVSRSPQNNYTDTGADPTKTYTYKVVPVISGKDGDPSPEAVVKGVDKIKSPEIQGILGTREGIQVRWTIVGGASFYNVYRSDGKDGDYKMVTSLQQNNYYDKSVKQQTTYYYKVSSVDRMSLESEKSKAQSGTMEAVVVAVQKKGVKVRKMKKLFESVGEHLYELENPGSLGVSPGGEIFVAERGGIQVLDPKGVYVRRIAFPPGWGEAFNLQYNPDSSLTMAFPYSAKIRTIGSLDGKLLQEVNVGLPKDIPPGSVNRPGSQIFDGNGNMWVSDSTMGQIVIFNQKGEEVGRIGMLAKDLIKMPVKDWPAEVFPGLGTIRYDPYGKKVYAALSTDAKIKVVDVATRKAVATYGEMGGDVDQFSGVAGFGFLKNGNFLMFDNLQGVVKEFTQKFEYVQSYGDVVDKVSGKPQFTAEGASFMYFHEPSEMFYFANKINAKVYVYGPEK